MLRDKAQGQNWIFTSLKQSRFSAGHHYMGSRTLPRTLLWNPQMQVKVVLYKEEAIHEHNPETLPASLGQSSSKMV